MGLRTVVSCAQQWDEQEDCLRVAVMSSLCLATILVALVQCGSMMMVSGSRWSPQVLILTLAISQLVLLFLHYGFFRHRVICKIAQRYLHIVEFCLICFFFASLALRVSGKRPYVRRLLFPTLGGVLSFVTVFFVFSVMRHQQDRDWLVLSVTYAFLGLAFVVVGCVITVTFHRDPRVGAFRMKKSRRLWVLILVNCVSALVATVTDIAVLLHRAAQGHEYHLFSNNPVLWYAHAIVNLVPLWAVMVVLWSLPQQFRAHHMFSTALKSELLGQPEEPQRDSFDVDVDADVDDCASMSIPYSNSLPNVFPASDTNLASPWSSHAPSPCEPRHIGDNQRPTIP